MKSLRWKRFHEYFSYDNTKYKPYESLQWMCFPSVETLFFYPLHYLFSVHVECHSSFHPVTTKYNVNIRYMWVKDINSGGCKKIVAFNMTRNLKKLICWNEVIPKNALSTQINIHFILHIIVLGLLLRSTIML